MMLCCASLPPPLAGEGWGGGRLRSARNVNRRYRNVARKLIGHLPPAGKDSEQAFRNNRAPSEAFPPRCPLPLSVSPWPNSTCSLAT